MDYPRDDAGNPLLFPGARAPDPAAHREATFRHILSWVPLDVAYARWQAGRMAKDNPEWHGDLLARLDAELIARGIKYPLPFAEPASKVPALTKGRRGLPKQRFFHDTL